MPLSRLFSLRHEFPSEWQKLTRAVAANESDPVTRSADLSIIQARFPFYLAPATLQPLTVAIVAVPIAAPTATAKASFVANPTFTLTAGKEPVPIQLPSTGLLLGKALVFTSPSDAQPPRIAIDPGEIWTIGFTLGKTDLRVLSDVFLVVNYTADFK